MGIRAFHRTVTLPYSKNQGLRRYGDDYGRPSCGVFRYQGTCNITYMTKHTYDHVRPALYRTTNHLKYLGLLLEQDAATV